MSAAARWSVDVLIRIAALLSCGSPWSSTAVVDGYLLLLGPTEPHPSSASDRDYVSESGTVSRSIGSAYSHTRPAAFEWLQ